jgi:hypothetical protein
MTGTNDLFCDIFTLSTINQLQDLDMLAAQDASDLVAVLRSSWGRETASQLMGRGEVDESTRQMLARYSQANERTQGRVDRSKEIAPKGRDESRTGGFRA